MASTISAAWRSLRDVLRGDLLRGGSAAADLSRGCGADPVGAATRALCDADRAGADRMEMFLTGTTLQNEQITFRPSDVWNSPLVDAHGSRIGAMFLHDEDGELAHRVVRWAAQETRLADWEVVPAHALSSEWGWKWRAQVASWAEGVRRSGQPPNYFFLHGELDRFRVSVNRGTETEQDWIHVNLDGRGTGQLLEAHETSALAIGRIPAGDHVLVACNTAAPGATAAREAADYLHSTGTVTGQIHAPTGTAKIPNPDSDEVPTELYVDRPTADGKLFETFRPPRGGPAPPADS